MSFFGINPSPTPNPDLVGITGPCIGISGEEPKLPAEFMPMPAIIGIQKANILPLGNLDALIPGGTDALIFLKKILNPGQKGTQDFPGVIGGAIVEDDKFEILHALFEN